MAQLYNLGKMKLFLILFFVFNIAVQVSAQNPEASPKQTSTVFITSTSIAPTSSPTPTADNSTSPSSTAAPAGLPGTTLVDSVGPIIAASIVTSLIIVIIIAAICFTRRRKQVIKNNITINDGRTDV